MKTFTLVRKRTNIRVHILRRSVFCEGKMSQQVEHSTNIFSPNTHFQQQVIWILIQITINFSSLVFAK